MGYMETEQWVIWRLNSGLYFDGRGQAVPPDIKVRQDRQPLTSRSDRTAPDNKVRLDRQP